jgi:3-oxoacyl-(acyl-carrier-protein) synthase
MVQHAGRRVVITGLGVVAPNGIGSPAFWEATANGVSGIDHIQRFSTDDLPIKVGGEVSDFVATHYIERKLVNRTARSTQFTLAATQEAVQDAQLALEEEDQEQVGAVIGCALGGNGYVMQQMQAMFTRGIRAMSAYTAIAALQIANAGQVSIRHNVQGYSKTAIHDIVGGLDALGLAYRAIRRGEAEVIITGGCDEPVEPTVLIAMAHSDQCALGDDPTMYRPFDRRATGTVLAEGAGICILEDYDHARRRGARIYGEIVGYSQTNDAHGMTVPSASGKHYARAIQMAMQQGQIDPREIAYFSADGRALPTSDAGEAEALRLVFGSLLEQLPVSVPRTSIGHTYAAAGPLDMITALLALQHRIIPPTINCEQLDPTYGLNLVRDQARPTAGSVVLLGGRATGGSNVTLAIKKIEA